jgi:hypothetical protein
MIQDVGYYGVLMAALWMQSASADVIVVEATGSPDDHYYASCPAGYVIVSTTYSPYLSSSENPTSASSYAGGCCDDYYQAYQFKIFCAKVCN